MAAAKPYILEINHNMNSLCSSIFWSYNEQPQCTDKYILQERNGTCYFLCKFNSSAVLGFLSSTNYHKIQTDLEFWDSKLELVDTIIRIYEQTSIRCWPKRGQYVYIKQNLSVNIIKNLMLTVALK